jgi:hypothetical protein
MAFRLLSHGSRARSPLRQADDNPSSPTGTSWVPARHVRGYQCAGEHWVWVSLILLLPVSASEEARQHRPPPRGTRAWSRQTVPPKLRATQDLAWEDHHQLPMYGRPRGSQNRTLRAPTRLRTTTERPELRGDECSFDAEGCLQVSASDRRDCSPGDQPHDFLR